VIQALNVDLREPWPDGRHWSWHDRDCLVRFFVSVELIDPAVLKDRTCVACGEVFAGQHRPEQHPGSRPRKIPRVATAAHAPAGLRRSGRRATCPTALRRCRSTRPNDLAKANRHMSLSLRCVCRSLDLVDATGRNSPAEAEAGPKHGRLTASRDDLAGSFAPILAQCHDDASENREPSRPPKASTTASRFRCWHFDGPIA
jgi:hypothetical protein